MDAPQHVVQDLRRLNDLGWGLALSITHCAGAIMPHATRLWARNALYDKITARDHDTGGRAAHGRED